MIFVCVLAVSCAVPLVAFADDEETECSHGWVQTSYPENTCESYTIDYTCSICGETYSEIYEGNGHTYVAVESYVHCTTEGYITYECSVCGDTYTETVDPVGHSYDILSGYTIIDDVIYAYYTCSYCGESVTSVVISDLYIYCDHANLEFLGAYDSLGLVVYYCSDCDCDIWYHTHYYTIIDVDYDSCTSQFYAMYECDFCGDTYTEYGDSNHYYVSISYSGVISYLCLICGDFYTDYELGEGFIIFDDYVHCPMLI